MEIPKFQKKEELFQFLKENNKEIIEHKKATKKEFCGVCVKLNNGSVNKGVSTGKDTGVLKRRLIINTTNWLDSHKDVHIDGLWDEALKQTPPTHLLKEHKFDFDNTISRDIEPKTIMYKWRDLGYDVDGTTQALVFDATIEKEDHPDMYRRYKKGLVDNHSVGMYKKEVFLCVNSDLDDYREEKENFDKYYPLIANKADVDDLGYFYAVTKAVAVEGSSVPRGSNIMTPTFELKQDKSGLDNNNDLLDFLKLIDI